MSNYLASSLKHLYDECNRIIEDGNPRSGGKTVLDRHNELLEKVKGKHPDNKIIQQLDEVSMSGAVVPGKATRPTMDDIQEVKFNVTSIADAIGLDEDDFRRVNGSDTFSLIEINQVQSQSQQQSATQTVTIEQLYEQADEMMAPQGEKAELRELVGKFEQELESENPDAVELRDVIDSAKSFSSQLAMKMAMMAFERGIDILIE